jgi:type I restriction-modification system DNA methylase subunit
MANGAMTSNSSNEDVIRKGLIEDDLVECMVALPPKLFVNTQIPACLFFLNKNKSRKGETLFIDARHFGRMETEVPDEDGGVLVNFGNVDAAAGMFEPKYTGQEPPQETTTPPPPVPEPQVETPKQELITQDIEESVALEDAKKKNEEEKRKKQEAEKKRKEEEEKERIRREEAEKNRLAEERRKKEQAISNKVAGAFGMGNAEGNSQGDAESGTGNQGSICKVITQALNGRTMMIVVGKQLEYLIPSVFLILCRKTFIQAMAGTGSLLN